MRLVPSPPDQFFFCVQEFGNFIQTLMWEQPVKFHYYL
jgi:hypothetical protein